MHPSELKIGTVVWTRVGQAYKQVTVVADIKLGTKRYIAQRTDNGELLKPRGAGKFHLECGPWVRHPLTRQPAAMSMPPVVITMPPAARTMKPVKTPSIARTSHIDLISRLSAINPEVVRTLASVTPAEIKTIVEWVEVLHGTRASA